MRNEAVFKSLQGLLKMTDETTLILLPVRTACCLHGSVMTILVPPFLGRRSLSSCQFSRIKRTMACNQATLLVKDAESERQGRRKGAGRARVYYCSNTFWPPYTKIEGGRESQNNFLCLTCACNVNIMGDHFI